MISFVIPAHEEEQHIGATIAAIRAAANATNEPFEIIVVDDDSHDATSSIAKANGARVIHVACRQIAATRNTGAKAACGEVLFFIDADTLANSDAVIAALHAIRHGAVGGGCVFTFDGILPLWARILYPVAAFLARRLRLVGGCFLFCQKEAFASIGGFCERYYAAEEVAFINALKKLGKFEIPKPTVITSGRKLRSVSFWAIIGIAARWFFGGPKMFLQRDGLEIWYGPRSPDEKRGR
ncbi:MAG: pgaC 2 [Planctomycetaceae bacterium]|nr:pgaC 2 [Planctomycetaceae bacterium]